MKKIIYIAAFTFLGAQLQFLLHSFIEQNYIYFLLKDFETFSFGFSWQELRVIHYIFSIVLLVLGMTFGFWQGKYWWKYIYVDKRLEDKFRRRKGLIWKILKY